MGIACRRLVIDCVDRRCRSECSEVEDRDVGLGVSGAPRSERRLQRAEPRMQRCQWEPESPTCRVAEVDGHQVEQLVRGGR